MEVPRFWRNNQYRINPLQNGFRPDMETPHKAPLQINKTSRESESAKITCITYNGTSDSYAQREVKTYSEIMKPSGVIYQNSGVAV